MGTPMEESGTLADWFTADRHEEGTAGDLREALGPTLDPDEPIRYHIRGTSELVRERDDVEDAFSPTEDGGSLLAVTERQVLFAVLTDTGERLFDVPLIDVQRVTYESGLFSRSLTLEAWTGERYRFTPAKSGDVEGAVEFIDTASECWQVVDSLLDDLNVHTSNVGAAIEDGDNEAARAEVEAAKATLGQARAHVESASLEGTLGPRLDDAIRDLHRTRMHARRVRATTLATEAKHLADSGKYTEAYERYLRAREHLEEALVVADEHGLRKPPVISDDLDDLETRIETLRLQPRALAKQARERATTTDNLDDSIDAWEQALEHYRDALTAGWGTDLDFEGEQDDLRFRIEVTVSKLIQAREEYALSLEAQAERNRTEGNSELAAYRYEEAIEQLEAAHELASEFRAGQPDTLVAERDRLAEKLDGVR